MSWLEMTRPALKRNYKSMSMEGTVAMRAALRVLAAGLVVMPRFWLLQKILQAAAPLQSRK
jgi:hypothetical protein